MTVGAGRIRELLEVHGIVPSRALGQNFLTDPNTARRIAGVTGAGPGDRVLEIGPGLGSLTSALVEVGAHVTAVEVDGHVLAALAEVVSSADPPVRVVHADALEVDLDDLLASWPVWRLAANLPYNVGTTILLRLLAEAPEIAGGAVLVQREVADRLTAGPGRRSYGIPSVKLGWWARAIVAGRVPASVFHPRPQVESSIVRIERRTPPGDEDLRRAVFALVDAGFGQRRKMLRRSLDALVPSEGFEVAGVDPTSRAEELDLDAWVRLARSACLPR